MGKIYDALKRAEQEANKIRNEELSSKTTHTMTNDDSSVSQKEYKQETTHSQNESSTGTVKKGSTTKASDLKLISAPLTPRPLISKRSKFSLSNIFTRKQEITSEIPSRYLPTIEDPHSIATEQYKMLRSSILSFCEQTNIRTLLVTSSIPGEGKSTVAANLAVSIANGINDHALLIDADLRKPTMHKSFSLNNSSGLSNYLTGNIPSVSQAIRQTGVEKLSILLAGTVVNNPAELLSSRKMIELIKEVRKRYDDRYIIIDSSPLQQTSEPVLLSKYIDAIVFVVRAGVTNRDLVKRSIDSLDKKKTTD